MSPLKALLGTEDATGNELSPHSHGLYNSCNWHDSKPQTNDRPMKGFIFFQFPLVPILWPSMFSDPQAFCCQVGNVFSFFMFHCGQQGNTQSQRSTFLAVSRLFPNICNN